MALTRAPDSLLQFMSRFFIIMLAILGEFNFSKYFKLKSKIFLTVCIVHCACIFCLELMDTIVTTSATFLNPTDVGVFYKTEYTFFKIHRLFNVCYVLVLSFHPQGFSKISDSLISRKRLVSTEFKKYNIILVTTCFLYMSINISIMLFITLNSDIDESIERHFPSSLNNKSRILKAYVLTMHFFVKPMGSLLFHSLFFTLIATLYCKFRSFKEDIEQTVIKDKKFQNVETLTRFEIEYEQLTKITKDTQNLFSLYLGVNIIAWMFMACGILYDSLTNHTTGYDTYIIVNILHVMITLLVCSLVNSEVMQCTWYIILYFRLTLLIVIAFRLKLTPS